MAFNRRSLFAISTGAAVAVVAPTAPALAVGGPVSIDPGLAGQAMNIHFHGTASAETILRSSKQIRAMIASARRRNP